MAKRDGIGLVVSYLSRLSRFSVRGRLFAPSLRTVRRGFGSHRGWAAPGWQPGRYCSWLRLSGEFGVGQSPVSDRAKGVGEPAEVGHVAHVEREHPLIQVAEQVERLDGNVGAVQATSQQDQKFSMPLEWT